MRQRRTGSKWEQAASADWQLSGTYAAQAGSALAGRGYGTDPNLLAVYHPGELWPLTFTAPQRRLAGILADLIIPADAHSPSASSVGVVEFIDEWVSAPYPANQQDRPIVLGGFIWLDAEAARRFGKKFSDLAATEQTDICDDICDESRAASNRRDAARFFARFRD